MILCLDYGERYIGIAITDVDHRFALRHSVIDQKHDYTLSRIQDIITTEKIDTVLIGLPVSISGKPSQQTKDTANFIKRLRGALPLEVKIKTIDETLTSYEAERRLKLEGGDNRNSHAEAARIMLEEYLRNQVRLI